MKVDFVEVGRDRKTWAADYEVGKSFERWAKSQIRANKALMSRDIEFVEDDPPDPCIEKLAIVAGVRPVGTILIHIGDAP